MNLQKGSTYLFILEFSLKGNDEWTELSSSVTWSVSFFSLFSESSTMFLFALLSKRLSRKVKHSRLTAPTPSAAQRSLNLVQSSLAERWSWRNHLILLSCDAELISYTGCIVISFHFVTSSCHMCSRECQ